MSKQGGSWGCGSGHGRGRGQRGGRGGGRGFGDTFFINQSTSIFMSPPGGNRSHNRGNGNGRGNGRGQQYGNGGNRGHNRGFGNARSSGFGQQHGNGKKEEQSSGPGIFSSLLLAGATAAVGFMAHEVWNSWNSNKEEPQQASSSRPDNMQARMKNRTKVQEQNISDDMKCVVCQDNPRETILMPCNHVCLCEDCASKINEKCPMCQGIIREKKPIYL